MVLNDWLDQLFDTKFNTDMYVSGDENPTSVLINGYGGDMMNYQARSLNQNTAKNANKRKLRHSHRRARMMSRSSQSSTLSDLKNLEYPRAEFLVAKGNRYRFRFINAGIGFCPLEISIADHPISIIALDGNPVEAFQVASFFILAGERVDIVLAANADPDAYWIKARGIGDCQDEEIFQTAILRYSASKSASPSENVTYETAGPNVPGKV